MSDEDRYPQGTTPRLTATITDSDDAAASPGTSTLIRVKAAKDAAGTRTVDDVAMTEAATGSFYYDCSIGSSGDLGTWHWEVIASDSSGSRISVAQDTFVVIKRTA